MTVTLEQVNQAIHDFPLVASAKGYVDPRDHYYLRNQLLRLLDLDEYTGDELQSTHTDLLEIMDIFVAYAIQTGMIENQQAAREIFEAAVMDLITPLPSVVNQRFWELYQLDPPRATDYFYQLSKANNYIQTRNIARNIAFKGSTPYGEMDITINLSKPEKDPVEIARARELPQVNYPKCPLCMENEGYRGHYNHAARQNHRIIRLTLGEEMYGFQYSPYLYYDEHSIVLNEQHIPMRINRESLDHLLEFVTQFPHYFIGSNADLPGVGGSILTHDHYQAGRYEFPMERAQVRKVYPITQHPDVTLATIHWPMSVLRLRSANRPSLLEVADQITTAWREYEDLNCEIKAYTDQPHNTVTPIVRRIGQDYEMDLVLRNNRSTDEFPLGIFHPHPDVQHIKRENIGLIEVMGLAILPPRLKQETEQVAQYLQGLIPIEAVAQNHQEWALSLPKVEGGERAQQVVRQGIADKFTRVLEDAGVFKQDAAGQKGLERFIASLQL